MHLTTASFLVLFISILAWLWKKNFDYWKNRGIQTPPYSLIWGNLKKAFLQRDSYAERALEFYRFFKSAGLKHGGIYMLHSPIYVALDLDIVKRILQVDFQHFTDRGMYTNETEPLSLHLFNLEGKKWRLLRNKLSPTFTSGKMKMMFETLRDCTSGLYKVMDNELGKPVNIKDILGRFTTDVIGSCAFGLDINSLENPDNEFRRNGRSLFHKEILEHLKVFILFTMPKLMRFFNAHFTPTAVSKFFLDIVKDTVAYREKNNIFRKDFMHLLIQLKNKGQLVDDEKLRAEEITPDDNKITIDEIAAQAFIFFEAGFETSATTMTFCLYELARNKTVQDKVRKELREVLAKYNGHLTYDAAIELHYMEQAINETLRMYPAIPCFNRMCTKDYQVPGTDLVLEKGLKVILPIIGIQRDPEFYPDPDKFDPDRFTEENKRTRPAFAFIPFGYGPRNCIGSRFGIMQTKVGLSSLLLNYEFTVNNKTQEPLVYDPASSVIMSTKGGIWLNCRKITTETIELIPRK